MAYEDHGPLVAEESVLGEPLLYVRLSQTLVATLISHNHTVDAMDGKLGEVVVKVLGEEGFVVSEFRYGD
ncbi:MAG: hypothetical protein P8L31_00930 [Pseudomonadales bacterium]|nr:hypothetical protein [Pseudomonadales bacterium]